MTSSTIPELLPVRRSNVGTEYIAMADVPTSWRDQCWSYLLQHHAAAVIPGLGDATLASDWLSWLDSLTEMERALVRGAIRLESWTRDGTLVSASTAQEAWGISAEALDHARANNEVVSVHVRGQHWYPAEALSLDRRGLAAIVSALGSEPPTSKLIFLLRHQPALGGRTIAQAANDGKLDDVLRLAAEVAAT